MTANLLDRERGSEVSGSALRRTIASLLTSERSLAILLDRLRKGRASALHETIAAARPAILAALAQTLRRQFLCIVPTPDIAERIYSDLLYYLGVDDDGANHRIGLVRARDEALGAIESPSERSARMGLLETLLDGGPLLAIAPVAAVCQYVPAPEDFRSRRFPLQRGEQPGWEEVQQRLYRLGYARNDIVSAAGEYAVRGGILDVFAATADAPTRIEFFGDTIESIRTFDIESQRSRAELERVVVAPWSEVMPGERLASATLLDYLRNDAVVVLDEPVTLASVELALNEERSREERLQAANQDDDEEVAEALALGDLTAPHPSLDDLGSAIASRPTLIFAGGIEGAPLSFGPQAERLVLECRPVEHFNRRIELFSQAAGEWVEAGERVIIVSAAVSRSLDLLHAAGIEAARAGERPLERGRVLVDHGSLESGFAMPHAHLRVLGDREIFGQPPKRVKLRAVKEGVPVTLADLRVGDYVVHAVHGIGQYHGLRAETVLGATQDYLDLHYAGSDRMLVPVTQMHQVTKYSASEGGTPRLSRMGGADWAHTKSRVSESLAKIADGLVQLYAERELARGHAFGADTPWQAEMEEAFPYDLTPDQRTAIDVVKADMERAQPMDRLICGDVGYGKTEVAMRAAFKAIADHKQVALLVPTTLLADQHFRTFSARFAGFPIRIESFSRFSEKAQLRRNLRDLAEGRVDLAIGTHRLLQKDVAFSDLGLIIVDEEQRFGVMHKERLKEYRTSVDVLTLSATPIPRTLHMALVAVRDLSLIRTAPKNRLSIKTVVVPAGDTIVQRAIAAELDRGGQVYYLHNRIESIYAVRNALQELAPNARIAVGHGQMPERELEPIMQKFIDGETDVLVATTIIENGIDIPNVNTMIVNDADKFGLAQLYQLRGRVGRSNHQAYCYLLYQGHKALTEEAQARLEAIREFTHLGSGLQIAMRDLEIRGAGNLLGAAQSGFVAAVGFDTYCQLLADAIAARRGMGAALEERQEAVIDVKISAFIPNDYIPQVSQKIAVYQQLAKARTQEEVDEIAAGVRDRFGPFPSPLERLIELTRLRAIALRKRVTRVVVDEERLTLGVGSGFSLDSEAIPRVQSLAKNRFKFGEGKIMVDLPHLHPNARPEDVWMPLLRQLLEAL